MFDPKLVQNDILFEYGGSSPEIAFLFDSLWAIWSYLEWVKK